jgi:catechol 2,3-dioxygenase-like lactoylglutathione lyase family enzyme
MAKFTCDHVHLRSLDPEAAAQFYVDMLGAVPVSRTPIGQFLRVVVNLGGLNLFIEQVSTSTPRPPEPPFLGVEHIGLAVTEFDATVAELVAKGVTFAIKPTSPRPGIKIAFVQAPDGVRVEILERSPV